jgi:hypothetical protein
MDFVRYVNAVQGVLSLLLLSHTRHLVVLSSIATAFYSGI